MALAGLRTVHSPRLRAGETRDVTEVTPLLCSGVSELELGSISGAWKLFYFPTNFVIFSARSGRNR